MRSESWGEQVTYKEASAQLLLHACLQKLVSGGARMAREYASGPWAHGPAAAVAAGRSMGPDKQARH